MCGQSEYFDRLFNGNWKEALDDAIDLMEDDPGAVEAMIRFMYENEYDSSGNSDGQVSPMLFDVRVYQVADKYGVRALKKMSKEKFGHATNICWGMDDFPHVITHVYSSSGCEELRETVARVSHEHIEILTAKDRFWRVLRETSGFAADIVHLMIKGTKSHAQYRCSNCEATWEAKLDPGNEYYCLVCGSLRSDWT
ncbi:hypothetical protein LTR47_011507 [Exophiala xenobiotica]|nr:hypothetical protein LTR92_011646 [Exophiala xenobiotica]KAK5215381.1 hypothetical protein LTR72_011566 [Exophiala xenobiotica]KAK5219360.1 hypothetical protein LTR47_011507 [Exophiala xenobiotica]KAK5243796.1 hypothetical protein LTS06_010507 [Exophiala xenobiotica]KAK5283060.1 hypothetical protein LTR40_002337 [Exophiala xenobiotica]